MPLPAADVAGHLLDVVRDRVEVGDRRLRGVDDVADALLRHALMSAAVRSACPRCARGDVDDIVAENAGALEDGQRVGADALACRPPVDAPSISMTISSGSGRCESEQESRC